MMKARLFFVLSWIIIFQLLSSSVIGQNNEKLIEGRAVWASPTGIAYNDSVLQNFIAHCKRAHINLIVLLVKYTDKQVYYHSKQFPESVAEQFRDYDPLAAVIREAHKAGIRVHAWLCDFTASPDGPIMKEHPEWAARNPDGKIPSEVEMLGGGRRYFLNWMCPARRPGYTDQWLLPMIEEIVANYDVDGIHHDYVRYPGDVAPDGYCFCDYCLEDMIKYAHFYYETFPQKRFDITPTLPNFIANWWSDPTVKPGGWDTWDRRRKAEYLLKGSFIQSGPTDLDYFFYTYRTDAIKRFVRQAWERASAIKPDIEMSAAVFKNPIASGRFIGQRWTDFAPWIDIMMPMVYRSHFPPLDYDTFLKQLEEYARYETRWANGKVHLSIGLDVHYIFNEERLFISEGLAALDSLKQATSDHKAMLIQKMQDSYSVVKDHLGQVAPELEKTLTTLLANFKGDENQTTQLRSLLQRLQKDPPNDYYPKEKLRRAIETVRRAGAKGIVIFNARGLTDRKLWPVLEEMFAEPSIDPNLVSSVAEMSIINLKKMQAEISSLKKKNYLLLISTVVLFVGLVFTIWRKQSTRESSNHKRH
ncbi:MAG: hypothetical protein D6813_11845 [Calditrichaeota bacterium]|nr:MAG: hypothetical protein D6813_11845 [Calditrichota bacterium]